MAPMAMERFAILLMVTEKRSCDWVEEEQAERRCMIADCTPFRWAYLQSNFKSYATRKISNKKKLLTKVYSLITKTMS